MLYFIIHCKRLKIIVDFRGKAYGGPRPLPLAYSLYAFKNVDNNLLSTTPRSTVVNGVV